MPDPALPNAPLAPELSVDAWLNTRAPLSLGALRGQVVVLHFFQMLCPGCVTHAVPQTDKLFRKVREPGLTVLGLHSVFEHHAVMTPDALRVFAHEFRLGFPIGIDAHDDDDPIPRTLRAYGLQGTPSTVLVGADGRIRLQALGPVDDLALGVAIGQALAERATPRAA